MGSNARNIVGVIVLTIISVLERNIKSCEFVSKIISNGTQCIFCLVNCPFTFTLFINWNIIWALL